MNPELLILMVCADVLFIAQQEQEYLLEQAQKENSDLKENKDSKEGSKVDPPNEGKRNGREK